jgi:hypothetical protein
VAVVGDLAKLDEAIGGGVRQVAQQYGIDDGVDRERGAEAERKRRCREERRADARAKAAHR